ATSRDGVAFDIHASPIQWTGIGTAGRTIYHVYDPRITKIGEIYYITLAIDTDNGCRIGLAQTTDFRAYEFLGVPLDGDARNGVLFPEKVNGQYLMLYRPNRTRLEGGVDTGDRIYLAASSDLRHWAEVGPVMNGRWHYWDELIGSGPPPVKTRKGWLHIYHGVATHFAAANIYQAGVALLDLDHPDRIVARSKYNILEPRELYELTGQVPNVVFPTGLIVREFDHDGFAEEQSEALIYYGAADTCVGLAITTIRELLAACHTE
ncbi:MAG: hypothetical protein GYA46_09290, partial [candidate division Zixibacteria bacterium]|nr:hypothetical protein [candidate division Zixibacteria bacterium]